MPDFLAIRNCSGVSNFFHSASVFSTFSVGSSGALFDVSIGFFSASCAWHEVIDIASMNALIR